MKRKKLVSVVCILAVLFISVRIADGVKITDVSYLLNPAGGEGDNVYGPDIHMVAYDMFLLRLQSNGHIDIVVYRGVEFLNRWDNVTGSISLDYTVVANGIYKFEFKNLDNTSTYISGSIYLNDMSEPTGTTTIPISPELLDFFVLFFYGLGAMIVILLIATCCQRRRQHDFGYLKNIEDDELLPPGWNREG